MSFSKEQLMTALRNADAAGDEEAARRIAQMVKSLEENGTEESPVITPTKTSFISRDEDGDRIFDDLLQDTKYADALRKWGGPDKSLEELREDSFEYFNSTMNNELSLADTVYDISQMNDDQKDNLKYLYDAYNETAVTGEGSRSGWEQFKDAGDLLWAPTTWLGGKFIAAPALKTASKAAIKAAFKGTATAAQKKLAKEAAKQSAKRSGVVSAGIVGGMDVGHQVGVDKGLDESYEYNPGQTALSTGLGYTGGRYIPGLAKGAGKVVRGTGTAAAKLAKGAITPIQSTKSGAEGLWDASIKAMGGKTAAEKGVALEGEKIMGSGSISEGSGEAFDSMKTAIKAGYDSFKSKYRELGDLSGASMEKFTALTDKVLKNKHISGMGDIASIKKLVEAGEITVSEGMRKMRSALGRATVAASSPNNVNHNSQSILKGFSKESRKLFTEAAEKSGLGEKVKNLDKQYSSFLKTLDSSQLKPLNKKEDASEIVAHIKRMVSEGNPRASEEYLKKVKRIGEITNQPRLLQEQEIALGKILGEKLFAGSTGAGLRRYLTEPGGKEVLKRLYPHITDLGMFDRLESITKNAHKNSNVGVYIMRILGGAGAGAIGLTGGPAAAALGGVGGLVLADKFLTSKWFMNQAMKVFSKPPKAARGEATKLGKEMVRRGYSLKKINSVMDSVLGIGVWAGFMQTDTSEEIGREIASMTKSGIGGAAKQADVLFKQKLPEFMSDYFGD